MENIAVNCKSADTLPIDRILEFQGELKKLSKQNRDKLMNSILKHGFIAPLFVWHDSGDYRLLDGHQRLATLIHMRQKGYDIPMLPVDYIQADSEDDAKRKLLQITSQYGEFSIEGIQEFTAGIDFDFDSIRLTDGEFFTGYNSDDEPSDTEPPEPNKSLADKFGIPPFSVLNAREGWWQDRKRAWIELGIKSEVGRGDNETGLGTVGGQGASLGQGLQARRGADGKLEYVDIHAGRKKAKAYNIGLSGSAENGWEVQDDKGSGTSIFDPVLTELAYRWFSPPDGVVLDPFAGGSVRGIVASETSRKYVGVELRPEQVEANNEQKHIATGPAPDWRVGDSRGIKSICQGIEADFLFSCPPYADLEVYSDNPADISTLKYAEFKEAYFEIIKNACTLLKEDRFACFVVGEVRDKKGNYYDFVGDTVEAFKAAGLHYYNEAILVTSVGSLPIRVGRQFSSGRKLGKTHQNVLVFVKGDGKKAAQACGDVEFGDVGEEEVTA